MAAEVLVAVQVAVEPGFVDDANRGRLSILGRRTPARGQRNPSRLGADDLGSRFAASDRMRDCAAHTGPSPPMRGAAIFINRDCDNCLSWRTRSATNNRRSRMSISRTMSIVITLGLVGCAGGSQTSVEEAAAEIAVAVQITAAADASGPQVCTAGAPDPRACDPADAKKTTVCHIPPGNPANEHTICIGNAAVPAHLAHGDHLGSCCGTADGGVATGGGGTGGTGGGGGNPIL
jgi:hypothetical protein